MEPYEPQPSGRRKPYVIAHRGISGKAPENTIAAFSKALAKPGIDMIELDVRLSKDGKVVVMHDRTLQRTSTGNGAVSSYIVEELKSYDAGSWFHPSFSNERIPLLTEVFELVDRSCWVNIELKGDLFGSGADALVDAVLGTVGDFQMQDQVLCSSFTHDLVAKIRRKNPGAITGVIYNIYRDFGRPPSKLASRAGASVFVCAKHEMTKGMVRDARQHGLALYVYTLNSVQDVRKMLNLGVNGIISDNADDIVEILREKP